MKSLVFFLLLVISFSLSAFNNKFIVPDSLITNSSFTEIYLQNKLFAFPLWQNNQTANNIKSVKENIYNRTIQLNQFGLNRAIENITQGSILCFPVDSETLSPAIIIFPGGGFTKITIDKEGIDIAQRLNMYGISTFVVKYRTIPVELKEKWDYRYSNSLYDNFYSDARQAISIISSKANEFNIDPNNIGVLGFSAGGRLAANLLVDQLPNLDNTDYLNRKINFGCLIYSVIIDTLIKQINKNTPPVFIMNCRDDKSAPAIDAEKFYNTLIQNGIKSEAHFFESGGHGFGLGVNGGDVTQWSSMFANWLRKMKLIRITQSNLNKE